MFGQALREIREAHDISQERLALEAGLDRTYISLIERGVRSPTIRTLVKVAEVLKVPPSQIVQQMEVDLAKERKQQKKAVAKPSSVEQPARGRKPSGGRSR